jgi:arylsulfatase A-like enzyme
MSIEREMVMFRRVFLIGSLFSIGAASVLCGAEPNTGQRPNILYIMADDLGPHDLGCYGQELIRTPNIDRLALQGTRFTQVCAGASVCAPSRSVLMTGLHTGHSRVRDNFSKIGGVVGENGEKGRVPLRPEDVTVAEVLKSAGYVTGITGKWGLGEWNTQGVPNLQGFDHWFGYLNQQTAHSYFPSFLWLNQQKFELPGNQDGRQQQYAHDLFTGFALNFIRTQAEKPFFLYLAYTTPHGKFQVPDLGPYADRNWREGAREYAAMVTRMDDHIGQVLALLDELKLRDNTIVFFCSDNGGPAPFGDVFQTNGQLRGKKGQVYEGGLRVPMIARWPGHVPAEQVSDQPWYFADVLPTLAAIAGAKSPEKIDGVSVLPTLLGQHQDLSQHFEYWEQYSRGFKQAARLGDWKAVRLDLKKPVELYDLKADPSESHDVASAHPDVVAKFESYLATAHTDSDDYRVDDPIETSANN